MLRFFPVNAMPAACIVRSLFATAAVGAFSAPTSFAELSCLFARPSRSLLFQPRIVLRLRPPRRTSKVERPLFFLFVQWRERQGCLGDFSSKLYSNRKISLPLSSYQNIKEGWIFRRVNLCSFWSVSELKFYTMIEIDAHRRVQADLEVFDKIVKLWKIASFGSRGNAKFSAPN